MVQENSLSKILVVCGPTASGKSDFAISLAKKFDGEVISADSVAIYKWLDIGSAKPSVAERRGIPHHMIDIVSPFDCFSVSDYERTALPIIEDVLSRNKVPVICGGTGFYINSLLYKMSYGNSCANEQIRRKYELMAKESGNSSVYEVLRRYDAETAAKLHPNDLTRVIRALEIYESTGVKKSEIKDEKTPRFDFIAFMPEYPREELYNRIDKRVDKMIETGLEGEVRKLLDKGVTKENQCMQGIGYKETAEAIISGEEIPVDLIKLNTRHYAKRQLTFFKKTENLKVFDGRSREIKKAMEDVAEKFLN